jgi:uncharacterized protein YbjT (DUF2867 family)
MKVVVFGGIGLSRARVVASLAADGHEAIAADDVAEPLARAAVECPTRTTVSADARPGRTRFQDWPRRPAGGWP